VSDHVIEPSEIIVENDYVKRRPTRVNPWVRFFARFVDYALFFLVLLGFRKLFQGHLPFGSFEKLIPFEFFVWIPIESLLLFTWGKTPGKWFLKTHLRFGRKDRPDLITALRRSVSVWFRGLGLGIPFVNAICLLVAYNRLKLTQTTSWDRDDHIHVYHDPLPRWRLNLAAVFAIGGMLFYFSMKNLEM
jgi:hypothetical protein